MKRAQWVAVAAVIAAMGCAESEPAPRGAPPPTTSALPAPVPAPVPAPAPAPEAVPATGTEAEAAPAPAPETGTEAETEAEAEAAPARPPLRPGAEPEFEALACLGRHDYACVTRLYGEGRAQSARQLAMVIQAQRGADDDAGACASMLALFERFPESVETARYRAFHLAHCPH